MEQNQLLKENRPKTLEELQEIRKNYTTQQLEWNQRKMMLIENAELFDAKLKQFLCAGDLARKHRKELEAEVQSLEKETTEKRATIRKLQIENNSLRTVLRNYENQASDRQNWLKEQQRLNQQVLNTLALDRHTIQRFAQIMDQPIIHHRKDATKVSRLRMQFDVIKCENERGETNEDTDATTSTSSAVQTNGSTMPRGKNVNY